MEIIGYILFQLMASVSLCCLVDLYEKSADTENKNTVVETLYYVKYGVIWLVVIPFLLLDLNHWYLFVLVAIVETYLCKRLTNKQ